MKNMGRREFEGVIALFVVLVCIKFGFGCIEKERKALLQFKHDLIFDFGILSSWGDDEDKRDCCRWRGVECSNQTGHVILLDLHSVWLSGKISASLAELQQLNHLDFSNNFFEGTLPSQFGNLSNLQYLDLSYNTLLTGESLDWLPHLPLLTHLGLSRVNLSKAVHWQKAIERSPSLIELHLSSCMLPNISQTSVSNVNASTSLAVLDLSANALTSSIYPWLLNFNFSATLRHLDLSLNYLRGSLPDAFGNMVSLASLDLTSNQINGSIPNIFGNMTSLKHLHLPLNQLEGEIPKSWSSSPISIDLSSNKLRGWIPSTFGNMTHLEFLLLSRNQLEGEIPKSLSSLCKLIQLSLLQNNLSGVVGRDFLACTNNTLEILDLSNNHLRGPFPRLSGFSELRDLSLGYNQLNGSLPQSIGQLARLELLEIPSNSLQGTVTATHLFSLSKLLYLDLSFNSLTFNISFLHVPLFQAYAIKLAFCKLGPLFPRWLQNQTHLVGLDISGSGISDVLPLNLTLPTSRLNISNNHISGNLSNLSFNDYDGQIDASSNCLEGSIPPSLFNITSLDLSNNMFSGFISLMCGATSEALENLDLSDNLLSGELPDCWGQFRNLDVLSLANNNFSGKIPNSMGFLTSLRTLHMRNNSLTGELPSSLKNCQQLRLIDLGKNRLSGKMPTWIGGNLPNLIVLNLRSNQFNGSIPSNLCQLQKLQMLDLSSNNISGTIPSCLNNFTAMVHKGSLIIAYETALGLPTTIYSSSGSTYIDNTVVQWKGKEVEYKGTLGLVKSLDFSSNILTGEIPRQVTDLTELVSLNLSRNNLTGSIPSTIGRLKSLDFLDLSQNQLHGEIPISLSQISGLSVLDLSNNSLSGKIPRGTQLQSFNGSSYEGNPRLCGPPLLNKCPGDETGEVSLSGPSSHGDIDSPDDANNLWFYVSIALGFIVGFWGVCGTLVLNNSWRHAYFRFLNEMKDWAYVRIAVNATRLQRSLQR